MTCKILILAFALSACSTSPSMASSIVSALEISRNKCGYDLTDLRANILDVETNYADANIFQQTYSIRWKGKTADIQASLTLDCATSKSSAPNPSTPVLTPKELIAEEDSGGRYMRHVAWQRLLEAVNWSATVAYIDYTFGDGQRAPTRDFIMCNRGIATPCITFSIVTPITLTTDDIMSALSILDKISVSQ